MKTIKVRVLSGPQICNLEHRECAFVGQICEDASEETNLAPGQDGPASYTLRKGDIYPVVISPWGTKEIPGIGETLDVSAYPRMMSQGFGADLIFNRR